MLSPEERKQCSSLRQTAMSASLFDSMSTRHAFKKSTDNISSLGNFSCAYYCICLVYLYCCHFSVFFLQCIGDDLLSYLYILILISILFYC